MPSVTVGGCCQLGIDDFNRAGPGYGAAWNKESGTDPTIAASTYLNFSAPGFLRFLTPHPDGGNGSQHGHTKFQVHSDGDTERIILAWLDANNYVWAQVVYHDPAPPAPYIAGCSFLYIGSKVRGLECVPGPVPIDLTADTWYTLSLCYLIRPSPTVPLILANVTTDGGKTIGLSFYGIGCDSSASATFGGYGCLAVTSGSGKFDDWYFGKAHGDGCGTCCTNCNTPCAIDDDNFNRADSADNAVGCKWYVRDGHQKILSSQWKITANGSRAQFLVPHPTGKTSLLAGLDVLDVAGAVGRLYLGGVYCEYTCTSGGHTFKLYDNDIASPTGGSLLDTKTDSNPPTGALAHLTLCAGHSGHGYGYGYGGGSGVLFTANAPGLCLEGFGTHLAPYAFIGGNNGTILDNFTLSKSRNVEFPQYVPSDPDCPKCGGCTVPCVACAPQIAPEFLLATIQGGPAQGHCTGIACSAIAGTSWALGFGGQPNDLCCGGGGAQSITLFRADTACNASTGPCPVEASCGFLDIPPHINWNCYSIIRFGFPKVLVCNDIAAGKMTVSVQFFFIGHDCRFNLDEPEDSSTGSVTFAGTIDLPVDCSNLSVLLPFASQDFTSVFFGQALATACDFTGLTVLLEAA